jgi:hypothetical protein
MKKSIVLDIRDVVELPGAVKRVGIGEKDNCREQKGCKEGTRTFGNG